MKLSVLIFVGLISLVIIQGHATELGSSVYMEQKIFLDSCNENRVFKSNYFESILYIQEYLEGKRKDKKTFSRCVNNVSSNSGIRSSVYYGYNYGYRKKTDFYVDKKKWLSWYEKNKCKNLCWK